jgi:rhamnosyltransferase
MYPKNNNILAVIVTYNSNIERLNESICSIVKQCEVLIVDNSTDLLIKSEISNLCSFFSINYLPLNKNYGIAKAINEGLLFALNHKFQDILLLDDDSVPPYNLVDVLLKNRNEYYKVIGSRVIVSSNIVNDKGIFLKKSTQEFSTNFAYTTELNSSGTLISVNDLINIGLFDEKLFIDCVDFEWGWRAQSKGYRLIVVDNIAIRHRLGESSIFIFKVPSPLRHYYQYRNVLKMLVNPEAPLAWKLSEFIKLIVKFFIIILLFDNKWLRICYLLSGVRDFFMGKTGKFKEI